MSSEPPATTKAQVTLVRPGSGRYTKHIQAAAPPMNPTQRATLTQSMSA